jgi:hypothetical protein
MRWYDDGIRFCFSLVGKQPSREELARVEAFANQVLDYLASGNLLPEVELPFLILERERVNKQG